MSTRSHLIQTNRSMIILDPNGMPVNLGQTTREDYPEALFPIMAYDGKNVIPTALGYRSFFGEDKKFNVGTLLNGKLVQQVFVFQTIAMSTVMIALAEDGMYVSNATEEPTQFPWLKIVDTSTGQAEGVRRLWTYCVISNVVYFYQQGSDGFYGLVDPAKYAETTIPEVITGASITQIWLNTDLQVGLLKYVPNFINMAGQLGIFKAANRLGFWDSENAVAWSSATQVYDFKPSTTTFAGVTTFVDVVGNITTIKQHGNGFIIYATKSITLVLPLSGSPERWTGRAIFSDVGVVFDIQVAVGQPDTVHFAITSGGLARIENGDPQFIQPEVMDYVRQNNELYALTVVESRYLFIHTAAELDDVLAPVLETVKLEDAEGNSYLFPKPITTPVTTVVGMIEQQANSQHPAYQSEFTEAMEPIYPAANGIEPDRKLVPCWTGYTLDTNFGDDVITRPVYTDTVNIPSQVDSGVSYPSTFQLNLPLYDSYYYGADGVTGLRFIDKAGDEYFEELVKAVNEIIRVRDTTQAGVAKFLNVPTFDVNTPVQEPTPSLSVGPGAYTNTFDLTELDWTWQNVIQYTDPVAIEANECALIYKIKTQDVKFKHQLTITEVVESSGNYEVEALVPGYITLVEEADGMRVNDVILGTAEPIINLFDSNNQYIGFVVCSPAGIAAAQMIAGHSGESLGPGVVRYLDVPAPSPNVFSVQFGAGTPDFSIDNKALFRTSSSSFGSTINSRGVAMALAISMYGNASKTGFDIWSGAAIVGEPEELWTPITKPNIGLSQSGATVGQLLTRTADTVTAYRDQYNNIVRVAGNMYNAGPIGYADYPPYVTNKSASFDADVANALQYIGENSVTLTSAELTIATEPTFRPEADWPRGFFSEVSGYGYFPRGGFSFRKTHSRSIFKACSSTGLNPLPWDENEDIGDSVFNPNLPIIPGPSLNSPYQWEYPDAIPLPDNYVMFKKGSLSPYYQTYEEAIVLDLQLEKWGLYSNPHKTVYSLYPVNRTDQSIVPVQDYGLRAGALNTVGLLSMFTHENPDSSISYGKIGDYRKGVTGASNVVADFAKKANCYLIVEASLNGDFIDPTLSQGITVVDSLRAELPFTATAKWFNIRFEGTFDLKGLSFESSSKGRR